MVELNSKTTQVHYSEFRAFSNHQVYIYFIYVFLEKRIVEWKYYSNKIFENNNSNQISIHWIEIWFQFSWIFEYAEFENFHRGLLKDMSNIPEENLSTLKTKLNSTWEKYARIKAPYRKLSKYQSIVIMKQDKRSVVVIMGKSKYHEKCLMILENRNFKTLDHDPTTKNTKKKYDNFYEKWKSDYHNKNIYLFTQVDFIRESIIEQLQSIWKRYNWQTSNTANCFKHWNCYIRSSKILSKAFFST